MIDTGLYSHLLRMFKPPLLSLLLIFYLLFIFFIFYFFSLNLSAHFLFYYEIWNFTCPHSNDMVSLSFQTFVLKYYLYISMFMCVVTIKCKIFMHLSNLGKKRVKGYIHKYKIIYIEYLS